MTLLGAGGYKTGTLTLSDFSWKEVSDGAKATVTYDSTKGSVSLGGSAVSSGDSVAATDGTLAAVATPASGCSFLGWVDADTDKLLPFDADTTLNVPQSMNVEAVFVNTTSDTAWFLVDDTYLTNDLNDASENLGTKIVLVNNGTLASGTYTIFSGDTLLIPYDDANTLCTTAPTLPGGTYTTPSVYRTLTMANGANITVNGAISVSGSQSSKYGYNGMPSGPLGFIKMNSGSTITVKSSANLYVWGYITGSGSVSVESGGTVYECFQIADYRGGDATSAMTNKADTYGVFPFNQYYVQNVEVPMTLYAGATEYGYGSVTVTLAGTQVLDVPFIGDTNSSSMFVINDGYIVKDYVEGTGRTEIKIHGDLKVAEITMSLKVALVGTLSIATSKYALPIPQHFTVSAESGSITMNQSMAFLPGSELPIKEGATCTLGSGKKIYVYDLDEWLYNSGANGYSGTSNKPYVQLKYVPGGDGTTGRLKDAQVQIDGTVDASAGSVYVTASGANIYSTGTGVVKAASTTDATAYQVITEDTDISSWPEIAMQPALLQNADGTNVATKKNAGTYTYADGYWHGPDCDGSTTTTTVAATCESDGYTEIQCSCGVFYEKTTTAALGHTEVTDAAVAATCVATGLTAGSHCSACGETIVAQKVIPAVDHETDGCIHVAKIGSDYYKTQAEAVTAYGDTGYIQMIADSVESEYTIKKIVYLDLNGCDVSGVSVDSDDGTLYGMDSTSDGYGSPSGSITVSGGTVATVTEFKGKNNVDNDTATLHRYLAVNTSGTTWQFHRFNISVTDYYLEVLSTGSASIGFGATFRGDSVVKDQVTDTGFTVNNTGEWAGKSQLETVDGVDKLYYTIGTTVMGDNTAFAMLEFNDKDTQNSESRTVNFLSVLKTYYGSTSDTQVKNVIDKFMTAAQLTWPKA